MDNPTTSNGEFTKRAEEIGEQAMAEIEKLRARAGEWGERLVTLVRERPGTSLIVAAAAGYLIGRIVRS
jgi:hypothetical protein